MSLFYSIISNIKVWVFKRRIKKFRETKNASCILDKGFNNIWIAILVFLFYLILFLACIFIIVGVIYVAILLFNWLFQSSNNTNIITLIVGTFSVFGIIYTTYKKRQEKIQDRYDTSLYIVMQYLIELRRGNYQYKLYKDDLSYIFMNLPDNILFILRDIQTNIKCHIKNGSKTNKYQDVANKEISFLIIHIREYYNISEAEIKTADHEAIIEDIILNGSKNQSKQTKKEVAKKEHNSRKG